MKIQHPNDQEEPTVPPVRSHCAALLSMFSICTLVITIFISYKTSDYTAILSTLPLWLWAIIFGLPALVAWIFFQNKTGMIVFSIWVIFGFATADFIPPLARTGMNAYRMTPSPGMKHWRVMSLDCANLENIPSAMIAAVNTDIIFLQGCSNSDELFSFAREVFGPTAQLRQMGDCAIIAANGKLRNAWGIPGTDGLIVDWIPQRSALPIRLVNVSLLPAKESSSNIFSPYDWKYYAAFRAKHRAQLRSILNTLKAMGTKDGELPVILAGNFNSAPSSPIFRVLSDSFVDAYTEKGTGLGATYPSQFPLQRHSRIFSTSPLAPVSSTTVQIPGATHQAIIADMTKGN